MRSASPGARGAVAALAVAACGHAAVPAPASAPAASAAVTSDAPPPRPLRTCGGPTPAAGPSSVRDVDWCNRSYRGGLEGTTEVVGGDHELHYYMCQAVPGATHRHVTEAWRIREVAFGDLDGDGRDEAALTIDTDNEQCTDEGSTHTTDVRAFALRGGQVVPIGWLQIRPAPGPRAAAAPTLTIRDGMILRTYRWADGTSCTDRFRLGGGDLEQLAPPCT